MKKYIIILILVIASCNEEDYVRESRSSPQAVCIDGVALDQITGITYSCKNYDLMSRISLVELNADAGNDCWGWTDSSTGREYAIMGVNNDDSLFLIYLDEVGINIGNKIEIIKKINFDNSIEIKINQKKLHITEQVAKHLLIKKH